MADHPKHVMDLAEALAPVAELAAYVLSKDGEEGLVLKPLGEYPITASTIAYWLCQAEDPYVRCIGALVPGWTPGADPELIQDLWREDIAKRDTTAGEGFESLLAASVDERFLMSAIRMVEFGGAHREMGLWVLERMVERGISGDSTEDSHFALAILVREEHARADEFVEAFCGLESGPEHFVHWGERLREKDPDVIANASAFGDGLPADAALDHEGRELLDALLEAARNFEEAEGE